MNSSNFPALRSLTDAELAEARELAAWLRRHALPDGHLRTDSRDVVQGDVFLALKGRRTSGLAYVGAAVAQGAVALLLDEPFGESSDLPEGAKVPCRVVPNLAQLKAAVAQAYYRDASAGLAGVAVTGTNGKTSTVHWISQILAHQGVTCARIGTLGFAVGSQSPDDSVHLTTPDAVNLQRMVRASVDRGANALAMEVSSIGIEQGRVDGMHFQVVAFTNLTQDHLDYHGSMQVYADAKRKLLAWPGVHTVILNLDDPYGMAWAREQRQDPLGNPRIVGYTQLADTASLAEHSNSLSQCWVASRIVHDAEGLACQVSCLENGHEAQTWSVRTALHGTYNLSNLLAAVAASVALGQKPEDCFPALAYLRAPAGRLDVVRLPGASALHLPLVIVDYAHTPDAIDKVLSAMRPVTQRRGGQLWIVFGAGGDRDPAKRPLMGSAALAADRVVVTSDNPRSEAPERIIEQICSGMGSAACVVCEPDRGRAIAWALTHAASADVIVLAGKGHETTQEIDGVYVPFSDHEQAMSGLQGRLSGGIA
jgi:UDP-N-acetylmuramyl-tripeptide synthetase